MGRSKKTFSREQIDRAKWLLGRRQYISKVATIRRVAEGKEAVSGRLRRSPDLADAVNLAWYQMG